MIVRLEKSFRADDGRTVYPDYFGGIRYEDGIYYILVSWITADVIRLAKLKYYGYMLMGDRIHVLTGDTRQANVAKFRELVIDSPVLVFDYSSEIVPE